MRKESEASLSFGASFKHKSGLVVTAEAVSGIRYVAPGRKAQHESSHATVNPSNVRLMTIHPDANSEARVEPYIMDTKMAAGSIADGHGGIGHDMMLVRIFGNPMSDIPAAKSTLSSRREEHHALASAVEAHGTLYNSEVMEVVDQAKNGKQVRIQEKKPNGEVRERIERVHWSANQIRVIVEEPEGVAELKKAA